MSLDASVGSLLANSYVTLAEADLYFLDRAHAGSWETLDNKETFLITASRMLDWQLKFSGAKTSGLQSMQFPRSGIVLSDGTEVPSSTIPKEIKFATFELAFSFIAGDRTADSALAGIEQVKAGPLFVKAVQGGFGDTSPKVIPAFIREMLSGFIMSGSMGVVWLKRA